MFYFYYEVRRSKEGIFKTATVISKERLVFGLDRWQYTDRAMCDHIVWNEKGKMQDGDYIVFETKVYKVVGNQFKRITR